MGKQEKWKLIPGHSFFMGSTWGRIKSKDRVLTKSNGINVKYSGKILKPFISVNSYAFVSIIDDDLVVKNRTVHRLILKTFSPNPNADDLDINHKNGIRSDNRLENLEWCTKSENLQHSYSILGRKVGRRDMGESNNRSKLTESDLHELYLHLKDGKSIRNFAATKNISTSVLYLIVAGKNWKHINIDWKSL